LSQAARDRDGFVLLTCRRDRRKQAAMMHRGSEPVQRLKMLRHGIALVRLEAITWAILRQLAHQAVARDFGDDRGRRDRENQTVAADHRFAAAGGIEPVAAIDEHMFRQVRQRMHRARQRPK